MKKVSFITKEQVAELVRDGMTIVTSGFVACALPENLLGALEKRFMETGHPKDLLLFHAAAQGNRDGSGSDHFAHEGMVRRVVAGHWNMAPKLGQMALDNKMEAYNFPQGTLSQLMRDIAAGKPGTITHVGLNTFADPRIEGGKLNSITKEDLVEVVEILGEEKLLYKAMPIDICFIRGTTADEYGNVTLEKEATTTEVLSIAQATRNTGGIVVVQVERKLEEGCCDPKLVKIPGICVDHIVVCDDPKEHEQCVGCEYDGSMTGDFIKEADEIVYPPMSPKKIIGRRAALELKPDTIVNLGIGIPEYVSLCASEWGMADYMTLTVESGGIGGVPQAGPQFGGAVNVQAIIDQPNQFDFYDGGGVDDAFLGLAEVDEEGNINVSKFGGRVAGCGGFINITQNAKRVYFCGTFTAGGLKTEIRDGKLLILQEGKAKKFIKKVEQITFSGFYAKKVGQPVKYITERCVFELHDDGLHLTEVAPGIDIRTQILDLMDFEPVIDGEVKTMDSRIFDL